jgi:hypothetical protein
VLFYRRRTSKPIGGKTLDIVHSALQSRNASKAGSEAGGGEGSGTDLTSSLVDLSSSTTTTTTTEPERLNGLAAPYSQREHPHHLDYLPSSYADTSRFRQFSRRPDSPSGASDNYAERGSDPSSSPQASPGSPRHSPDWNTGSILDENRIHVVPDVSDVHFNFGSVYPHHPSSPPATDIVHDEMFDMEAYHRGKMSRNDDDKNHRPAGYSGVGADDHGDGLGDVDMDAPTPSQGPVLAPDGPSV